MTKNDVVKAIRRKTGMINREAFDVLDGLLEIIKATLENGEDLKIPNFGVFEVQRKDARLGRNLQTGEALTISSRQIVTFRPAALLKKRLNEQTRQQMGEKKVLRFRQKAPADLTSAGHVTEPHASGASWPGATISSR